jgi:hypothetical protein
MMRKYKLITHPLFIILLVENLLHMRLDNTGVDTLPISLLNISEFPCGTFIFCPQFAFMLANRDFHNSELWLTSGPSDPIFES